MQPTAVSYYTYHLYGYRERIYTSLIMTSSVRNLAFYQNIQRWIERQPLCQRTAVLHSHLLKQNTAHTFFKYTELLWSNNHGIIMFLIRENSLELVQTQTKIKYHTYMYAYLIMIELDIISSTNLSNRF
mgnify:CR=1 FL=1